MGEKRLKDFIKSSFGVGKNRLNAIGSRMDNNRIVLKMKEKMSSRKYCVDISHENYRFQIDVIEENIFFYSYLHD